MKSYNAYHFHSESTSQKTNSQPAKALWQQIRTQIGQRVQQLWTYLLDTSEPKVSIRRNRNQQISFRVYDPANQTQCSFYSEDEVRRWLEQRHYR